MERLDVGHQADTAPGRTPAGSAAMQIVKHERVRAAGMGDTEPHLNHVQPRKDLGYRVIQFVRPCHSNRSAR
jgi:hypothetical protein